MTSPFRETAASQIEKANHRLADAQRGFANFVSTAIIEDEYKTYIQSIQDNMARASRFLIDALIALADETTVGVTSCSKLLSDELEGENTALIRLRESLGRCTIITRGYSGPEPIIIGETMNHLSHALVHTTYATRDLASALAEEI
jgi:hypothetical protein